MKRKHTEEEKNKISEGLKKYYNNSHINIIKHRECMAKSCGINIYQYDINMNLINTFISIAEAERKTGINHSSIGYVIHNKMKLAGGFIWKNKPG